jgi:hypothetical protein
LKINNYKSKNKILVLQKLKINENTKLQMKIENYIEDKEKEKNLKYEIKNLKRKIEINQKKYKRALILKKKSNEISTIE